MAIPTDKNRIIIVNDNLVGPSMRTNNPYGFHPMVRKDWGMVDKLRAVLANYYAPVGPPLTTTNEFFINYSNPGEDPNLPGWVASHQVENIVLDFDDPNGMSPSLWVSYDLGAWNAFSNRSSGPWPFGSDDFLATGEFSNYLKGSYFLGDAEYGGLLNYLGSGEFSSPIKDHTSVYYLPLANEGARVQPVYNSYLPTVPPYENVISNPSVPEYVLPNAYMFQAELQDTGPTLVANYHNDALTLGGDVPLSEFVRSAETTEVEYYQLYSEKLQQLLAGGSLGDIEGVANNKNLAILYSDMAIADESHLDIAIPFYNKIVIDSDSNSMTGLKSGGINRFGQPAAVSILQTLAEAADTNDFIELLQMRTIQYVLDDDYMSIDFRRELKTLDASVSAGVRYNVATVQQRALYNLEAALDDLVGASGAYDVINSTHTSDEFSLLRDFSRSGFVAGYDDVEDAEIDLFDAPEDLALSVTRTFKQVLDNVKCHTETLMYVIEKRRVLDNGEPGEIQQRFFISNRFEDTNKPIVYYDSQVKYGQRYRYDIKKIALVFGNEYSYEMASGPAPPDDDDTAPTTYDSLVWDIGSAVMDGATSAFGDPWFANWLANAATSATWAWLALQGPAWPPPVVELQAAVELFEASLVPPAHLPPAARGPWIQQQRPGATELLFDQMQDLGIDMSWTDGPPDSGDM